MISIQRLIEQERNNGYLGDNASAKVCQDIVLKALASSSLSRNVTIKGGVVMRSKTNNTRRATQDLDIDFIKYSLADKAIDIFIRKLNCIEGISINRIGEIEELRQQDYSGKRVYILIKDTEGNCIKSKIDLGVHRKFEIEQEEYCFDIAYDDEGASLLVNSNEQMLSEKLRSLLKFGTFSTRFKDIYDMYYLMDRVNIEKLRQVLQIYVFDDESMREKNGKDIAKRLKTVFADKAYIARLSRSDKKWIDDDVNEVTAGLVELAERI